MLNRVAVITALVALSALLAAPAAHARTVVVGPDEPARALYQSWIDEALVPTADVEVRLHLEHCPEEYGGGWAWCFDRDHGPPSIWVGGDSTDFYERPEYYTEDDRLSHQLTFLHELGHVFDYTPRPRKYRRVFMHIMRYRRGSDWELAEDQAGQRLVYPDEQFAMGYAFCALFPHWRDADFARTVWWGYDYAPTPAQYERVCRLMRDPNAPWARRFKSDV